MTRFQRRLKKLESAMLDDSKLVPHSLEWRLHWMDVLTRGIRGEPVKQRPTLEIWDDVILGDSECPPEADAAFVAAFEQLGAKNQSKW